MKFLTERSLKYIAFSGLCYLALQGREVKLLSPSKESFLFYFCILVMIYEMLTEPRVPIEMNKIEKITKKDFSEFEQFMTKKKRNAYKGEDHILQRVIQDWKMDSSIAEEISKLLKLVVRDYIQYWFVNVSKRTEFVVDVEEILTNAVCTFVRRGHDFINPYMFVGDKVCNVLVKTLKHFREACQKVITEHPDIATNTQRFHVLVANEFRMRGRLHMALMTNSKSIREDHNINRNSECNSKSEIFKESLIHAANDSSSDMSMEEFFDPERLASIESEYSFYVGGYLTKYLMDNKEENSRAGRRLFTEILSNILLGSIYWLCTPSSVYYYIHMAVSSLHKPDPNLLSGESKLDLPTTMISEIDLHVGMKEYFVGSIGEENVSSSCCSMAIEAAAAIVLRETSPQDRGELPSHGHFIIRKVSSTSTPDVLSLLPAVFCLSYIRPKSSLMSSTWRISDSKLRALSASFDAMGLSAPEVLNKFAIKNTAKSSNDGNPHCSFPVSFADDRVGHVVFLAHTAPHERQGICYEILSCSHQSDLKASLLRKDTLEDSLETILLWTSFEELLESLRKLVPSSGLQLIDRDITEVNMTEPPASNQVDSEIQNDDTGNVSNDTSSKDNERTLLKVEKDILLNHELSGAVEEYMAKKFAHENRIIQISDNDDVGRQSIKRLMEAVQNICVHGWLKKRFVLTHPPNDPPAGSREDIGRHIATCLSKMYSKVILQSEISIRKDENDNTYEEFLNKSPVLWLWLGHIISHCKSKCSLGCAPNENAPRGPSCDNSMVEKMNISQRCICLKCGDANCYVQSMDIFLDHHGAYFNSHREVNLDCYFECMLFCGLQTGKLVDILEVASLVILCNGNYAAIDNVVRDCVETYSYSPDNVDAVRSLSSRDLKIIPADQFAPEAVLKCCFDCARALSVFQQLRDHYLHYFKGTAESMKGERSDSGGRGRKITDFPFSPSKEKRRSSVLKSMSMKTISAASSLLDDISNSLVLANRSIEGEPQKKPRHLLFSTNMDIVQVSHIKLDAAQEKWQKKVGEGALFGSELQRRAEAAFKLRILLRDRPQVEFLQSKNILRPQFTDDPTSHFSSYNIEILKYEKLSISSSTQQVVVYYIDVYQKKPFASCPVHRGIRVDEDKDSSEAAREPGSVSGAGRVRIYPHKCTCKKWTIKRRYTDFDEFHKHMKSQLDHNVLNRFKLPQKAYVQVVQSSFFYARRLMGLREYLRSVLLGLPNVAEVSVLFFPTICH